MAHFSGLKIGASPMMVGKLVVTFSSLPVPWWPSVSQSFCYSSLGWHCSCKFAHVARESCAAQNSGWALSPCSWFSSTRLQGKQLPNCCLLFQLFVYLTGCTDILTGNVCFFRAPFELFNFHYILKTWDITKLTMDEILPGVIAESYKAVMKWAVYAPALLHPLLYFTFSPEARHGAYILFR